MEKVRPWCGQPSDRGRLKNRNRGGWQVTLCDPMWHVSSRSSVATLRTAIHLLLAGMTRQKQQRVKRRDTIPDWKHWHLHSRPQCLSDWTMDTWTQLPNTHQPCSRSQYRQQQQQQHPSSAASNQMQTTCFQHSQKRFRVIWQDVALPCPSCVGLGPSNT